MKKGSGCGRWCFHGTPPSLPFVLELIIIFKKFIFQQEESWAVKVTLCGLRATSESNGARWGTNKSRPWVLCVYIDLSANSFHYPITRLWSIVSISQDAGGLLLFEENEIDEPPKGSWETSRRHFFIFWREGQMRIVSSADGHRIAGVAPVATSPI